MPQIYEVTIVLEGDRATEFETYMSGEHIPEVLATGCFTGAVFAREGNRYVFSYNVNTPDDMQRYLDTYATDLRDEVIRRFGEDIQSSRRMLDVIKTFPDRVIT